MPDEFVQLHLADANAGAPPAGSAATAVVAFPMTYAKFVRALSTEHKKLHRDPKTLLRR